jgi:hypothetical protein
MNDDLNNEQNRAIQIDVIDAEQPEIPEGSFSGETCYHACRFHRPMRLASIAVITSLLGLCGLFQFLPAIANVIHAQMLILIGLG